MVSAARPDEFEEGVAVPESGAAQIDALSRAENVPAGRTSRRVRPGKVAGHAQDPPRALVEEVDRLDVHHGTGAVDDGDSSLRPIAVAGAETLPRPKDLCIQTVRIPAATQSCTISSATSGRVAMTTASTPPGIAPSRG